MRFSPLDAANLRCSCPNKKDLKCEGMVHGEKIGACAMTTIFLDNKICTFKIVLSWRFPMK